VSSFFPKKPEISKVIVVRAYNKAQLFREFYSPIQIVGPVAQVANLRYTLEISVPRLP